MGIANEMWKRKVILSSDYAGFTELDEIEYRDRISEDYEHRMIKHSNYPGRILDSILQDLSESNTVFDVGSFL
jgi:hypothetical protein